MYVKRLLTIPLMAIALTHPGQETNASAEPHAAERVQIQQLIERFKAAVVAKDGSALRGMFLPDSSWLMALDEASLVKLRARKPEVRPFMPDTYEHFATFVSTATKPIEETFDQVHIETDGTIGMVYFDYRFLTGGKLSNRGTETWQVVHTDHGWKISAMLYSVLADDAHR
mgnify:CR=1 FL=1